MKKSNNKNSDNKPQSEAAEYAAHNPPAQGQIALKTVVIVTAFIALGGSIAAFGGYIGYSSDHNGIGFVLLLLGTVSVFTGIVIYYRAAHYATKTDVHIALAPPPKRRGRPKKPQTRPLTWKDALLIILGSTALVTFLSFLIIGTVLKHLKNSADAKVEAMYTPPIPTNATQQLPDGRILLVDVTPEYLDYLYRKYTNAEAEKLMTPYWDKWIVFDGSVSDLTNVESRSVLTIERKYPFDSQTAFFKDANQIERLQPLTKGNPVKTLCKVKSLKASIPRFILDECELLDL